MEKLPSDVFISILGFMESKDLQVASLVSKQWNAATKKAFARLAQVYESNPALTSYVQEAQKGIQGAGWENNLLRVKHVFQHVMGRAKEVGIQEKVSLENLAVVASKIPQAEDENLIQFFKKVPRAPLFYNAKEIKEWMGKNQESLKQVQNLAPHHCQLKGLPKEIRYFTALQTLFFSNNQLTALPKALESVPIAGLL